jgi:hypothetical protein
MFELNLETVVQRGVRVVRDTVTGLRMASQEVVQRASGIVLSKRHLAANQRPASNDGPRYDTPYGGRTAVRAGRLAGIAGALSCRWSLALRGTTPATTLPTVPWRTLRTGAITPKHQGRGVGHSRLHLLSGAKRQAKRRFSSPRLTPLAAALQMRMGMEAKATMRGR